MSRKLQPHLVLPLVEAKVAGAEHPNQLADIRRRRVGEGDVAGDERSPGEAPTLMDHVGDEELVRVSADAERGSRDRLLDDDELAARVQADHDQVVEELVIAGEAPQGGVNGGGRFAAELDDPKGAPRQALGEVQPDERIAEELLCGIEERGQRRKRDRQARLLLGCRSQPEPPHQLARVEARPPNAGEERRDQQRAHP